MVSTLQGLWLRDVRELEADEPRIFIKYFLLAGGESAHNFLDAKELVDLGLPGEESVSVGDLSHYAADCPNVHFLTIDVTEQKLGGSVPARCHVVSKTHAWLVLEDASKPEITDAESVGLGIDKKVFWLDVTVDDVVPVTELDGLEKLVDIASDSIDVDTVRVFFKDLEEVFLAVFKYEVETVRSEFKLASG